MRAGPESFHDLDLLQRNVHDPTALSAANSMNPPATATSHHGSSRAFNGRPKLLQSAPRALDQTRIIEKSPISDICNAPVQSWIRFSSCVKRAMKCQIRATTLDNFAYQPHAVNPVKA